MASDDVWNVALRRSKTAHSPFGHPLPACRGAREEDGLAMKTACILKGVAL